MLNMVTVYNKALDEQRREGKKVGDRQRQIKTAKRLIKEKMKPEFISKITDLSIEEIEKLKQFKKLKQFIVKYKSINKPKLP